MNDIKTLFLILRLRFLIIRQFNTKKRNQKMKKGLVVLLLAFLWASCNQSEEYKTLAADPLLYCKTVKELNNIVMGNNFTPIVASRNYLYANVAAYEVIAAARPDKYNSLAGQLNGLQTKPPAPGKDVNYHFAAILAFCKLGEAVTFPEGSMSYYVDSLTSLMRKKGMPKKVLKATREFADKVSEIIMDWSKKDNYAQTRTMPKYAIIDSPGRWVPTPPMYLDAIEPHWNKIRPAVMDSANMFVPPPPPPFDIKNKNSKFYKEMMAVKNAVENLTDEQKHIADFWDDLGVRMNVSGHVMFVSKKFSPPGHWMNIVGIAAKQAKADFETTVYAYAKTAIAVFDAFIQCWDEKYRSNYARPETVINKYIDPNWRPYLQTPAFPEYTCGHSTISAAAAEALTDVFGDNFAYTDTSELEFGIPNRSFKSFRHAAEENNWARFYGGIHYHNSCIISTEHGRKVGTLVNQRLKMKK
ncbi:MAG: vanadium-dependent haloperoxidase [Chitinophagaceae bacterium]|nr:vanadium-dependent haloperoxidase [Chitinophagaceae bacterium]